MPTNNAKGLEEVLAPSPSEQFPFSHLKDCGIVSGEADLAEWVSLNPGSAGLLARWLCARLHAPERGALLAQLAPRKRITPFKNAMRFAGMAVGGVVGWSIIAALRIAPWVFIGYVILSAGGSL